MKQIFFALTLSSLLIACKKENTNPTSLVTKTPTSVEDTIKKTADSVSCVDNPKINFSCVGTPVGKLSVSKTSMEMYIKQLLSVSNNGWLKT